MQKDRELNFHFGEVVFALSGLLILISALSIYLGGSFILWHTAKVLYALGLLIILKYA